MTGASAAYSLAQSYASATAFEALEAQVAVLQGEMTAIIGEESADQFQNAMDEARQSALSLSDYAGGNYLNSISSVFGNLASKLRTAYQATHSIRQTLSVAWSGYVPLVPA